MNRIAVVLLSLLALFDLRAVPGYSIRSWGVDEGLPSSQVSSMDQTSDGRLWLATSRGLCVYDGFVFETFTHANHPELGNSDIVSVKVGPNDQVWFVDQSGKVGFFDGSQFHERSLASIRGEEVRIRKIAVNQDGLVIGATGGGAIIELFPHEPSVIRRGREWFEVKREFSPGIQIYFDSMGQLVAGLHTELIVWAPNGLIRILPELNVDTSENRAWLWAIGDAAESGFWTAADMQLRRYAEGVLVENRGEYPWGDNSNITALLETRDGMLWVGSQGNGLRGISPNATPAVLNKEEGLPSNFVRALFEDQEGNLWAGTEDAGLVRIRARLFDEFDLPARTGDLRVNSIVEDRTHDLWMATEGDGLIHWDGTAFRSVFGADKPDVNVVLADSVGNVWAGTRDRGLHVIYPNRTNADGFSFEQAVGFESDSIVSLFENSDGQLWVATEEQVLRLDNRNPHQEPDYIRNNLDGVRCMAEDREGALWLGTMGQGLYRWLDGELTQFTVENGLPDNSIMAMCRDDEGRVILGSRGAGVLRVNGESFERIHSQDASLDPYVAGLANDGIGSLWLSTSRGITRIPWADLELSFGGERGGLLRRENYGKEDGLVSLEGQDRFHPSILVSELGKLYFPQKGGIVMVALEQLDSSFEWYPPVSIRSVTVDGDEVPLIKERDEIVASCPPGSRKIVVRFSGVGLSAPEKVVFQYRVDRMDTNWNFLGNSHSISFLELDPGEYDLEVTAALQSGEWNPESARLRLQIIPYWWETLWARWAAVLGSLALVGGGISFLARQRIKAEAAQRTLERAVHRERERIAQDMHDDLGARLTQLSFQGELAKRSLNEGESGKDNLDRVVDGVRQTAQALDDIVWMTNPRNDSLDRLFSHLAQIAVEAEETAKWGLRLSLPDTIPPNPVGGQIRHEIVMVVKELINNASKHSECSQIQMEIQADEDSFSITIADNGIGFDMDQCRDRGNGLVQMQTRLERIGGRIVWESHAGRGTRVSIGVKIKT